MLPSRSSIAPILTLASLVASGCGNTGTSGISGAVYAPNGELAAVASPSLLQRLAAAIVSEARAMTGLERVSEGVEVRLERLDRDGSTKETLTTETTASDGTYSVSLATGEEPASTLIMRVGSDSTRMRAFVTGEHVDISPISEVTVRLVIDSDYALANFSPAELRTIKDAINQATDAVDAGDSIETATNDAEASAKDDADVTAAIRQAGSSS